MHQLLNSIRHDLLQISRFVAKGVEDIRHIEANKQLNVMLNEITELALRTEDISKTYMSSVDSLLTEEQMRRDLGSEYVKPEETEKKEKGKSKKPDEHSGVVINKQTQRLASKEDALSKAVQQSIKGKELYKSVRGYVVAVKRKILDILSRLEKLNEVKNEEVNAFVSALIEKLQELGVKLDTAINWSAPKQIIQSEPEVIPVTDEMIIGNKHVEELLALADMLDAADQEEEANKIDEMVKSIASEQIVIDSEVQTPNVGSAFEKLAEIADKLDEIGAKEEADLMDDFLSKHAHIAPEDAHLFEDMQNEIKTALDSFVKEPSEMTKKAVFDNVQKYFDLHEDLDNPVVATKVVTTAAKKDKEVDSYDSKEHHKMQVRPTKETKPVTEHHVKSYQETKAPTLSIRTCPEHIGAQMARVGENTYQCSLDGAIYNWETGFTANNIEYPGSSVAAQTGNTNETAIPHRVFDSREKALSGATY